MELSSLNNGFGPIYRKRNGMVHTAVAIAIIAAFPFLFKGVCSLLQPTELNVSCSHTDLMHLFSKCCAMVSSLIFGEIVRRSTLFVEEVRHTDARYQGSKFKAFLKCMTFGDGTKVSLALFYRTK